MSKELAPYQKNLIDLAYRDGVLEFGLFTLKSGRESPFFMNLGRFSDAESMSELAEAYAKAIHEKYGEDFNVLFGPAYKAISIASSVAMKFYELYGANVRFCSNRKEAKDHGDVGSLVGSKLKEGDRVIIVEDVTTAGTSMEEVVPIIKATPGVKILGLMVAIDRQEYGKNKYTTALQEIKATYGFEASAILSMRDEIAPYLHENGYLTDWEMRDICSYYMQYGPKEASAKETEEVRVEEPEEAQVEEPEAASEQQVADDAPCEEKDTEEEEHYGNPT